jgi:hypothetical protein
MSRSRPEAFDEAGLPAPDALPDLDAAGRRSQRTKAALISETFGTGVRYSGAGLGYQLASVVAGGPAPLIAAAILAHTGASTWISLYIIGCAVVSFIALLLMPQPHASVADPAPAETEMAR